MRKTPPLQQSRLRFLAAFPWWHAIKVSLYCLQYHIYTVCVCVCSMRSCSRAGMHGRACVSEQPQSISSAYRDRGKHGCIWCKCKFSMGTSKISLCLFCPKLQLLSVHYHFLFFLTLVKVQLFTSLPVFAGLLHGKNNLTLLLVILVRFGSEMICCHVVIIMGFVLFVWAFQRLYWALIEKGRKRDAQH